MSHFNKKLRKKTFLRLNESHRADLVKCQTNLVVAMTIQQIKNTEIAAGHYGELADCIGDGQIVNGHFTPDEDNGRASAQNLRGRVVVRRDLPPVWKNIDLGERPIWGDYSNGTFHLSYDREVLAKQEFPPRFNQIRVEVLSSDEISARVAFTVEQILDRTSPNFEEDLLQSVNLLQENLGSASIVDSNIDPVQYALNIRVNWEILPVGNADWIFERFTQGIRSKNPAFFEIVRSRIAFFQSLNPQEIIIGATGFDRYLGAKFSDELVIFENMRYGNAVYVMRENWAELSKRSRVDLLRNHAGQFERIIHRPGWENRIRTIIGQQNLN